MLFKANQRPCSVHTVLLKITLHTPSTVHNPAQMNQETVAFIRASPPWPRESSTVSFYRGSATWVELIKQIFVLLNVTILNLKPPPGPLTTKWAANEKVLAVPHFSKALLLPFFEKKKNAF